MAASSARSTFGDFPLVLMPIATSPGLAERLDLPREHAIEPVVVADRRQRARVRRQRERRPRLAFLLVAADQLRGEVLRVRRAAAVAEHQHRAAPAFNAAQQPRDRRDDPPPRSGRRRSCSGRRFLSTRNDVRAARLVLAIVLRLATRAETDRAPCSP